MEQLNELATALAKAQATFPAVPKSGKNPFLKNEYATLDDIIGAVRGPLGENGLSFLQLLGSNGDGMTLRTVLLHESGQMMESTIHIDTGGPEKGINALQSLGKAVTYMKRYMLGAMLGIATDGDTDGEGTTATAGKRKPKPAQPAPSNRPLDGPTVRDVIRKRAGWQDGSRMDSEPITDGQVKAVGSLMAEALKTQGMTQALLDKARHDCLGYLLGLHETKALTKKEASAIIAWLKVDEDGNWDLNEWGRQEAANVLTALAEEAGQQRMEL